MGVSPIIANAGASAVAYGICRYSDALFYIGNRTLGDWTGRGYSLFMVN